MVLGRCEINLKAEARADANRPHGDLGVFNSDLYQESAEIPESYFPLVDGTAALA
jgi:hypothetical protein